MPKMDFELPTGEIVTLAFGAKYPMNGSLYHQGIRSGRVKEDSPIAHEYRAMKETYVARLADYVAAVVDRADAVLSPPSSRNDADNYRSEIQQRFAARDLTLGISRRNKIKAAEADKVEEMVSEFDYKSDGQETNIKTLLIVDESIASGKTVSALLEHLRSAGLPTSSKIVVAVWSLLTE